MKKENKSFKFAAKVALPIFLLILVLVAAAGLLVTSSTVLNANGHYPLFFVAPLWTFNLYEGLRFLGQIVGNVLAYLVALAGIVLFILSLAKIKHDKSEKAKAAILSCLLALLSVLGLIGGSINFFSEGIFLAIQKGANTGALIAFLVTLVYVLDAIYLVLTLIYVINELRIASKVKKGLLPQGYSLEDNGQPVYVSEDPKAKEEERRALLIEIRRIVREELERLDRVAIVKEQVVEKPVEKVVVTPAPAPVVEEEAAEKKKSAPRIPFAKKMVSADSEIQEKYNDLKAELLAYGASSRVSIGGDTFRLHRKAYVKITLVGKTLKVYFALNPNDYVDSPIPVTDAGDKSVYEEVPALLKVKSDLSLRRAKLLAEQAFGADGIYKEKAPEEHNFIRDLKLELKNKK